jgi:hypothetical protein
MQAFPFVELEVSEQLALLCDTRLEGGPEGFADALEEMSQEEVESLFGEAIDALLDAQTKHEREMRRLAQRLQH